MPRQCSASSRPKAAAAPDNSWLPAQKSASLGPTTPDPLNSKGLRVPLLRISTPGGTPTGSMPGSQLQAGSRSPSIVPEAPSGCATPDEGYSALRNTRLLYHYVELHLEVSLAACAQLQQP